MNSKILGIIGGVALVLTLLLPDVLGNPKKESKHGPPSPVFMIESIFGFR